MIDTSKIIAELDKCAHIFRRFLTEEFGEVDFANLCNEIAENGFPIKDKNYGATKGVMILNDDYDFVLKIPFSYDCDENAYLSEDYCDAERARYEDAADYGYEKIYLKIDYLTRCGGFDIYIQQKAISFSDYYYGLEKEERETKKKNSSKYADILCAFDNIWKADLIAAIGEDAALSWFRDAPYYLLEDLHRGNYGYTITDHKPVIIDYGGYHESSHCTSYSSSSWSNSENYEELKRDEI